MKKNSFTINSRFIASLYDIRFSEHELDKKKVRDVYRAAFVINKYYSQLATEPAYKETLTNIVTFIKERNAKFNEVEEQINLLFANPQKELIKVPQSEHISIPYQWENKLYLSLVGLLIDTDKATWRLKILKENDAVDSKLYYKLLKQAANPLRSIIDKILKN